MTCGLVRRRATRLIAPATALALVAAITGAVRVASAALPQPIVRSEAEYPAWARGSGIGTEVELRVLVGRDGRVRDIQVVPYHVQNDILTRGMRASFDSAAVRAVRRWRFRPASRGGRPMASWIVTRVTFEDPSSAEEAARERAANRLPDIEDLSPQPLERVEARWPAAAPFACKGKLVIKVEIDSSGTVRKPRVLRSFVGCADSLLSAAVDSAAVVAARGWRYPAADAGGLATPREALIVFLVPTPVDPAVVVGCVRDSASGRPLPDAEITARRERAVSWRADATGWFVLPASAVAGRELRAHVWCRGGGFRKARAWERPGDEVTLYVWQSTCIIDGR